MDYRRLNNYTGWAVFLIALVVYLLTMAPTASYWDCGEFIACSNELEVPHPPGAPFFLLVGRLFAMMAFGDVTQVAFMVNLLSVFSSAFTVLFTFWITTYLAKRIIQAGTDKPLSDMQTIVVLGAGVVAGLANTFADSFWFNAVEAEVYAMSSFFTAIVVWLMTKWETRAEEPGNEKWIILIAYIMGLSIGVHLLNLLTIPALAFMYYFKKYDFSWSGFFATSAISVGILGLIQTFIIINTFDIAWWFERLLVEVQDKAGNHISGMGLPIGSGLIFFFLILFGAIVYGIYYSNREGKVTLNTALLSVLVIYIGFSSYMMIPIRSNANPPIDENNPDATHTFISYMKREQYGNRPLFRGPLYNRRPVGYDEAGKEYILEPGSGHYTEIGTKVAPRYNPAHLKVFPRMYESGRYNMGPHAYANYVKRTGQANTPYDDNPTNMEDMQFFFGYQIVHMYWRYFMWNFAGKQGDVQDMDWESGLNFGKTADMPEFIKKDPAKNHYYLLPFLLGLLGLFWQAKKQKNDAIVVGLLFFFTGLAIVIYLNQYPSQPRERDYSFAGSFQTFAIWIGLGVTAIYQLLEKRNSRLAAYLSVGLGIIPPIIMGVQNWDDHSRAGRYVAPDSANNLLESLEKDAILFTNGDNDTFPLWYIQEVERVRPDVRVLCLSYVNTDWYIDQMYRQYNESPPLPLDLKASDYTGQSNQSRNYGAQATITESLPVDPSQLIADGIVPAEDRAYIQSPMSWTLNTRGSTQNRYLELKDVLIRNLLKNVAQGGWKRPVYFANTVTPSNFLGLDSYLRQEGLAYRILPVKKPAISDRFDNFKGNIDSEKMYTNLTEKFRYRGLNDERLYFDENIIRMVSNYHNTFHRLTAEFTRKANALERTNTGLKASIDANDPTTNVDSLQAIYNQNQSKIQDYRGKAESLVAFAEENFPIQGAEPDPFLIIRSGVSYDQLGQREKADEYYEFAVDKLIGTLKFYHDHPNEFFPKQSMYIQVLRYMGSIFRDPTFARPELALKLDEARQQLPRFMK